MIHAHKRMRQWTVLTAVKKKKPSILNSLVCRCTVRLWVFFYNFMRFVVRLLRHIVVFVVVFPRLRNSFEMLPAQRVSLSFCICCCWSQCGRCVDLLCSCVLVLLFPRFSLSVPVGCWAAVGPCAHLYTRREREETRKTPSVVARTVMGDK